MGNRRGRRIDKREKKDLLSFIDEAISNGARIKPACEIVNITIRTYERWKKRGSLNDLRMGPKSEPFNKLSKVERQGIINICTSREYRDLPPSQIVPHLADIGQYIASESTFYRILKEESMLAHRSQSKPPINNKPTPYIATKPNMIWSWDITYLKSSVKGVYYYLYMVMDVYSRKIVGWNIHECENSTFSSNIIYHACREENITRDQLVLHSDNGGPMKGATMLATLQNLGVIPSFSRPSVSNDNPYSESLFKTLKYSPSYPQKPFASISKAKSWVNDFVDWYNNKHLHSGIKFVTPSDRHSFKDTEILNKRKKVYEKAKAKRPERWSGKVKDWRVIEAVKLNSLKKEESAELELAG